MATRNPERDRHATAISNAPDDIDWHDYANYADSAASHMRRAGILLEHLEGMGAAHVGEPPGDIGEMRADLLEMEKWLIAETGYGLGRLAAAKLRELGATG